MGNYRSNRHLQDYNHFRHQHQLGKSYDQNFAGPNFYRRDNNNHHHFYNNYSTDEAYYHRSNSFLNQNFNQPPNYNFHNQNKNNKYYQNQPSTHQSIFNKNNHNHIEQQRSATLNRQI